jgi:hypothetical protein
MQVHSEIATGEYGSSYNEPMFSLNSHYAKLHQETAHFLVRLIRAMP